MQVKQAVEAEQVPQYDVAVQAVQAPAARKYPALQATQFVSDVQAAQFEPQGEHDPDWAPK
jgi:hypothetical protein